MRLENNIMAWKQLEYSKNQVDKAGHKVIEEDCSSQEYKDALKVVDNWRAAHGYPLYIINNKLKKLAKKKGSFVVHRLKRIDSIVGKLERNPKMSLRNMQDIGGCRAVVPNVSDVYEIASAYQNSRIRHEKVGEKDYINNPKPDGYRCLHHVYKYKSDDKDNPYNGMKIEIQFRTTLQHLWATAVEIMGLSTNTNLKAGIGDEKHKRFFALVSSLFSVVEETANVPNTPLNPQVLISEILDLDKECNILERLSAISTTVHQRKVEKKKNGYFILELNIKDHNLNIYYFKEKDFKLAVKLYDAMESERTPNTDIVLVSASSANGLRKAYPNYFGDIKTFAKTLQIVFDSIRKESNKNSRR